MMKMKHTTLTLDEEQIKKMKERGINISQFVRERMSEVLDKGKELEETLEYYKKLDEELHGYIKQLEKIKRDKDEKRDIRLKKLVEKCKDIPEIHNLSQNFLVDSKEMMKLVEVICAKYEIRISISEIREYYKLKAL